MSAIVILYLYDQNLNQKEKIEEENKNKKIDLINLDDNNFIKDDNDIINFLFNTYDLYPYNPQAYNEMKLALNDFLILNKEALIDNHQLGRNYDIMVDKKRVGINAFLSMLYNVQVSPQLEGKLNHYSIILEGIFNGYLENIIYLNDKHIYDKGVNINTKFINLGPEPINVYENTDFSYEMV